MNKKTFAMHAALLVEKLSSRFEVTTCRATGGTIDITGAFLGFECHGYYIKGIKTCTRIDWGVPLLIKTRMSGRFRMQDMLPSECMKKLCLTMLVAITRFKWHTRLLPSLLGGGADARQIPQKI